MFGTLKKIIGRGVAVVERRVVEPAPLPRTLLSRQVVLIGASVSEHWHIEVKYPRVEVATCYTFDKTPIIDELVAESTPVDGAILKQCAAYFPIPMEARRGLVEGWLDRLEGRGIRQAVATVVPVTASHAAANPGRLEGIVEYNDWICQVAERRGLPVLDLAGALRVGPDDPHLDPRWATRDGLHLRRRAYRERLDPLVGPVLEAMFE